MENNNYDKISYAPTETPSLEEFSNFRKYVFDLFKSKKHENSGCIKVE